MDENEVPILQSIDNDNQANNDNIANLDENQNLRGKTIDEILSTDPEMIEKQHLIEILNDLKVKLSEGENRGKTIEKVYEDYINNDDTEKNEIKLAFKVNWNKAKYRILLHFMFLVVLPSFTIINLVGIFQMISVMNNFYDGIKSSIRYYFYEDEDISFYNFYGYYFIKSLDEGINFDLMETMGFLGTVLLNFSGFTVTSVLCLFINVTSLFLIINFYNQYNPS